MLDSSSSQVQPSFSAGDSKDVATVSKSSSKQLTEKIKTKAKVLHVINGEHYSGAERVQDLLGNRLPEFGYEVGFACVKPGIFADKRSYPDVPVHMTEMSNRFDWGTWKKIAALVKEHGYEMIHAHTPRSALVGGIAAKKCNVPFVFHVHSPTSRDSTRWLINWINQFIEKWSIRNADRIITVSDSLMTHMIELGFDQKKISIVPNGVPIQEQSEQKTIDRLTANGEEFVVGTVALFRPRKGTEVLLRAIARLKEKFPQVRLLAVGPFESAQYEDQLKSLAKELEIEDSITWTGFTQDVAGYFGSMNAFALPSLFGEGLPMVVLEAMSQGVPVVASDVEGIPQAIRDGKDGLIVGAGDDSCLAEKLGLLVADPNQCLTLGKNALERQQSTFSDVSMARELSKVYDRILR